MVYFLKTLLSKTPNHSPTQNGVNQLLSHSSKPPLSDPAQEIKRVFDTIQAESCPHHYNFHLHTLHSDGALPPEMLMKQAIALGLKGLAITDHHTVAGFACAHQWQAENPSSPPLKLWSGIEITAHMLDSQVHILGYGFDIDHPILVPYVQGHAPLGQLSSASRVIDAIHMAKGIAVLAHPHRYKQSAAMLLPEAVKQGIDGIEVYYAYDNMQPWRPSPQQTPISEQLAQKYNLLKTCGTDSHGLTLLHRR